MSMKKAILLITSFLLQTAMYAQNQPVAPAQNGAVLILNATAHLGNGQVIPNSAIGFDHGKLTLVADATVIRLDRSAYKTVIDGHGKHVYPGLIAMGSTVGLTEIDLVRSTIDFAETGDMNPNVRAIISYNTDSKIIPTLRSNGVLLAQIAPQGGMISGQSSVVQLDAWNWEDAAYRTDEGVHLNWPRMYVYRSGNPEQEEQQRQRTAQQLAQLDQFFREAKAYSQEARPQEKNLRFESMRGLFDGSKKLYVRCDYVKEITAALDFCKKLGIRMVLEGGADSWRVADRLVADSVPVVLGRVHSLPPREDDDTDLPYKLPALLKKAGVQYALSIDGSWQNRNLPFMAGTSAAYGIDKEEALMSVTSVPAKILGIDAKSGTIEVGKDANLLLCDGDLLDMRSSHVTAAFIQGRDIDLDNVQKRLNKKYSGKYGIQ